MEAGKSKILIIGGTGSLGQWISRASLALHHPTFLLVRPPTLAARPPLLHSLAVGGASILQGSLEDKSSLVEAIKQVDIVISAVPKPQLLAQINIVEAIQQLGCTQRFLPSEFGIDVNGEGARETLVDYVGEMFEKKRRVRQAIEATGISYSYVCSCCFAEPFAKPLGQGVELTAPPIDKVTIFGDGHTKASYMCEKDIGFFTIKVANDPRTLNKTVHLRFPKNILSQLELVTLWERKIGRTLEKTYLSEEEIKDKFRVRPLSWESINFIMRDAVYIRGLTTINERDEHHLEASELYPQEKYISMDEYMEKFIPTTLFEMKD